MRRQGFTLIEVVVVVAIVGILASAVFPLARMTSQRARESELRIALRQIRTALDAYKEAADAGLIEKAADSTGFPSSLDDLAKGKSDITQPGNKPIYFLRRVPRDPMFPDPHVPAAQTWGTRAYASPPDNPQVGKDVFDVYSLSAKTGLNGVPYREW